MKRLLKIMAIALMATAQVSHALAENPAISEHAVKAVLFYKLPHFVYLPEEAKSRVLNLCALGSHPVVAALEKLAQTSVDNRTATFQVVGGAGEAGRCDFVYISRDETASLDALLHRLDGRDVVTVSDIPGFARSGGMVEFAQDPESASVRILINRKAARKQGIEFNAQLLRLARIVEP